MTKSSLLYFKIVKMKMKNYFFGSLIIIWYIFLNCSKNTDPLGSDLPQFVYPMEIGNQWEYHRVITLFNFRPDSITNINLYPDTIDLQVIVKIENKQTLGNTTDTYKFVESADSLFLDSESYYSNNEDGLYLQAYKSPGTMFPKSGLNSPLKYKENSFSNIFNFRHFILYPVRHTSYQLDSLHYEDPPILIIKYPYQIGEQWHFRSEAGLFQIDKKIIHKENVTVPPGRYECYKIQYLYDLDLDNQWDDGIEFYDYLGKEGLLKRTLLVRDIQVMDENAQLIGLLDYKEESVLTGIILHVKE